MVLSQETIIHEPAFPYHMRDLKESDAEEIAEIFKIVYNGQYPLKQYEDPDWIRERVNDPSFLWKVCAEVDTERPVGCGVMILDHEHGRLYGGRTVLLPELQGKGIMNKIGMEPIKQVLTENKDALRIFYGESRTEPENIAMQRTLEALGFKPLGLLIDFDTGEGERESEIIQAYLFPNAYNRRKDVKIIPQIEPFYNVARRQFPRIGKEYEIIEAKKVEKAHCNLTYLIKPQYHWEQFEIHNKVARISTEVNTYTNSLEILDYTRGHPEILKVFLEDIITFCNEREIFFIEAHASAYDPEEQQVFLDAGFKIAGYFPSYKVVDGIGEDGIIMIRYPDQIITKGFEFTKRCWKVAEIVLNYLNIEGEIKISERGNFQFYLK